MKKCIIIALLFSSILYYSCRESIAHGPPKDYGADDYGMKVYTMAFLKAGPHRDRSDSAATQLQQAHMANIQRMADEGKLILAGPFMEDSFAIRGIYIFDTPHIDSARAWTETDPAISAGSLITELHPWYGSAALMDINNIHESITKNPQPVGDGN